MSSERKLGDRWAEKMRRSVHGFLIQKIPASSVAGFPDWLVVGPTGIQLIEAKRAQPGRTAYNPRQLTGAQHWFLGQVARRCEGGTALVLVLAEDGYVMLDYAQQGKRALSRKQFDDRRESYAQSK